MTEVVMNVNRNVRSVVEAVEQIVRASLRRNCKIFMLHHP